MFEPVKFVKYSRGKFPDVVVIEEQILETLKMMESCGGDGLDGVVAQR